MPNSSSLTKVSFIEEKALLCAQCAGRSSLFGYRSIDSTLIEQDPPTADGDRILFYNKGLSREDDLPILIMDVKRRISELELRVARLARPSRSSKALAKAA